LGLTSFLIACRNEGKKLSWVIATDGKDSVPLTNKDDSAIITCKIIDQKRERIKLGHAINTSSNEYLPILNEDASVLYFSAMDRTGFFDFKLDFTKQRSAGGEDIYISRNEQGVWSDARPIKDINTNGHEVVTQVLKSGDLLVTANYPENLGTKFSDDAGTQTTDLFLLKSNKGSFQIIHLPEPVNSIFTEADAWMSEDESFILFVSDRSGNIGDYHKKGWKWNDSFWGNTDVYVSLKIDDNWTLPVNLGSKVNTPFAERTPWLSRDGLTLFLSSNGYEQSKTDLDIYAFKRKSTNDWTSWEGPFVIKDANTQNDDWGYKETKDGQAYLASSIKLGFKPTQGGVAGDGGIRETNYRSGYELYGLQVAALSSDCETNIYFLQNTQKPTFVINDVYFDFGSAEINENFKTYLSLIIDQILQNKNYKITINGYTDDIGDTSFNKQLSYNRAQALKDYFVSNNIKNKIVIEGRGESNPILPNNSKENRVKNRRVEIYLNQ
jgi:outer membrane protein OmpA-like peptidoglycan-associated protein